MTRERPCGYTDTLEIDQSSRTTHLKLDEHGNSVSIKAHVDGNEFVIGRFHADGTLQLYKLPPHAPFQQCNDRAIKVKRPDGC